MASTFGLRSAAQNLARQMRTRCVTMCLDFLVLDCLRPECQSVSWAAALCLSPCMASLRTELWGLVARVPGAFPYTDCSVQPASRRSMSSTFDPNESMFANAWIKTDVSPIEGSHAPCHPSLAAL
jgi:hypothetical protein